MHLGRIGILANVFFFWLIIFRWPWAFAKVEPSHRFSPVLLEKFVPWRWRLVQEFMSGGSPRNGMWRTNRRERSISGPHEDWKAGSRMIVPRDRGLSGRGGSLARRPVLKGTLTKSQERAKERTLRRREVVRQDAIVPPGMTYLESRSVRTPTILDYTKRFQEFQGWMNMHQINIASPLDLDSAAVEFLEDLFEANRGVNDGVRVIAAIKFFWPHLAKEIPRTSQALKGWNLAAPPQQRMPVPIEVLSAIMGVFLQRVAGSQLWDFSSSLWHTWGLGNAVSCWWSN